MSSWSPNVTTFQNIPTDMNEVGWGWGNQLPGEEEKERRRKSWLCAHTVLMDSKLF